MYLQFRGVSDGLDSCFDHDCGVFLGARVQVQTVVVPIFAAEITTAGATTISTAVRWPVVVRTFHSLITGEEFMKHFDVNAFHATSILGFF